MFSYTARSLDHYADASPARLPTILIRGLGLGFGAYLSTILILILGFGLGAYLPTILILGTGLAAGLAYLPTILIRGLGSVLWFLGSWEPAADVATVGGLVDGGEGTIDVLAVEEEAEASVFTMQAIASCVVEKTLWCGENVVESGPRVKIQVMLEDRQGQMKMYEKEKKEAGLCGRGRELIGLGCGRNQCASPNHPRQTNISWHHTETLIIEIQHGKKPYNALIVCGFKLIGLSIDRTVGCGLGCRIYTIDSKRGERRRRKWSPQCLHSGQ